MKDSSNTINSLAHTKWNCKYHIVFAPKYRRKVFYEEHRLEVREILRKLCESLIEKLCRDCIDIRLLNLHLLRDIKKRSEKSFSNEVRDYCKQNTRLRLAVARDRANLLFCSAHAD